MEEKKSGQGEIYEIQTNLWVESILPRITMQGLTTEQLGCICEAMAKRLIIFDILDANFYTLNGRIYGSDFSKFVVEILHYY